MSKKLVLIFLMIFPVSVMAEPLLLGAHLLLSGLASNYLPDNRPTSYHGPFLGLNYGWKYELSSLYKINPNTEGSNRGSLGFDAGYQFLCTDSWDFGVEIFRHLVDYKNAGNFEGEDTIDGVGVRVNYTVLVFKLGFASHGFKDTDNYYDAGYYTGFGLEYVFANVGISFEMTDYYVGDRQKHLSGFDVGLRYYFDNSTGL
ncbi:MAG: hypothetical protein A2X86_14680 [Bdellovibrionales bacterium GWA2_49_15]|nr:MAG: hypothetical protein A2X86_14680 [Bdellovibrionales bacterium GWA2_49_15]HAZ13414.1 hypothetical protein [Bdellovibrionales bacterium]